MAYSSDEVWQKMKEFMDKQIRDLSITKAPSAEVEIEIRKQIKDFYFQNGRIEKENINNLTNVGDYPIIN